VSKSETGERMKIRVMNVNKKDLLKDMEKASEFDQSPCSKRFTKRNSACSAALPTVR
jgi:type VI secretion system protein ImpC